MPVQKQVATSRKVSLGTQHLQCRPRQHPHPHHRCTPRKFLDSHPTFCHNQDWRGKNDPTTLKGSGSMSTARITESISVEDYLEGELVSSVKHEYIAGAIFAMVGARNAHNMIAGNVFGTLHSQLRGKPCRPFNSDTKIRVKMPDHKRFYYPDVSVVCDQNPQADTFQDHPVVVMEVLSASTRRLDDGEKRDAYFTISSLMYYILLEQDAAVAVLYQRTGQQFERRVFRDLDDVITLDSLGVSLPLRELYEGVVVC